jgi:hypothetical protein
VAQLRRNKLRTPAENGGAPATGAAPDEGGFDTIADLVAELVAATGLVPPDRLAAARGRAGTGSLAQALAAEGHAKPEGVARAVAR